MVLQRGEVTDLLRQVAEAGSRERGVSGGSLWIDESLPAYKLGGLRKPARRAPRGLLRHSALVLMTLAVSPTLNQTHETASRPAVEIVNQQREGTQKAEAQNAAQTQNAARPQNAPQPPVPKLSPPQIARWVKPTPQAPPAALDPPASLDDLGPAIVRRYVHRNIERIRYCYERQRLAKPTLAGTVEVRFLITPDGTVAWSTARGVDDEVASCVAGAIKDIEFPRSGGGVLATYPFRFVPSDH